MMQKHYQATVVWVIMLHCDHHFQILLMLFIMQSMVILEGYYIKKYDTSIKNSHLYIKTDFSLIFSLKALFREIKVLINRQSILKNLSIYWYFCLLIVYCQCLIFFQQTILTVNETRIVFIGSVYRVLFQITS